MLKLFYAPGACSRVSHIVIEESGAEYESHAVDFAGGENESVAYKAINPTGRVPALLTDRGAIVENCAIVAYLGQRFPEARLFPANDPFGFAEIQALNVFIAATIHPLLRVFGRTHLYVPDEAAIESTRSKVKGLVHPHFQLLEDLLSDGRNWLHKGGFSAADPYLFVFFEFFGRIGAGDLSNFPYLRTHSERVSARPAVINVLAREQPQ